MRHRFVPDHCFGSVHHITPEFLLEQGIKGLICDVDNTLVAARSPHPEPQLLEWAQGIQQAGIKVCLLSNNCKSRVDLFNKDLKLIQCHRAAKPLRSGFARAAAAMGLPKESLAVVGDQIFTDIWGGKRFGIRTILVPPVSPEEGKLIRMRRRFERRYAEACPDIRGGERREG